MNLSLNGTYTSNYIQLEKKLKNETCLANEIRCGFQLLKDPVSITLFPNENVFFDTFYNAIFNDKIFRAL